MLQKRSKEERREREKKTDKNHTPQLARQRSLQQLFFYGTGLCLLEWCGVAVRNFQAKEIERALGRPCTQIVK